jgi:cation-transporting ATPase I
MPETPAAAPRVVHSLPGRARVHVPSWGALDRSGIERALRDVEGVTNVSASFRTGNVLVEFDRSITNEGEIVAELGRIAGHGENGDSPVLPETPASASARAVRTAGRRARIAVRGLERDPELARSVVEQLESRPEVARANASVLTGRVLVELVDDVPIEPLLEIISELEGENGAEPTPSHPLDPAPLIQGSTKLVGAALGLGLLAMRTARGAHAAPVERAGPAEIAGTLGILEGLPALTARIEDRLGYDSKELAFGALSIISLTFSGSTLGLALAGVTGLRAVTESRAKRRNWSEYEHRLSDERAPLPGDRIRLNQGERAPLPAKVVEGHGTAVGADGLPHPLGPWRNLESGAKVFGGPLTVEVRAPPAFRPTERPPPPTPALDRYLDLLVPASLLFAGLTGVLTRSVPRALTALLLVNPRPALEGAETADNGASARAARSGVTVVGSRRGRPIRRPDAILLDSPRVLADGFEVARAEPLESGVTRNDVLGLASAVAAAAGSPWGNAFAAPGRTQAVEGDFDGHAASAHVNGDRYVLAPPRRNGGLPAGTVELLGEDEYPIVLRREQGEPVGLVSLRPRIAPGAKELFAECRRHGIRLELLARRDSKSARGLRSRTGISVVRDSAAARVRALQREGKVVAVVSDSAAAGEVFDMCDLAIGLTSGRSGHFPARADVLAPGLSAVAAVVEAGVRRDAAIRDAVWLSLAANAGGTAWGLAGTPRFNIGSRATYIGSLAAVAAATLRLRGGHRPRSVAERLADPQPERWGRQDPEAVMRLLGTGRRGLTVPEALERRRPPPVEQNGHSLATAVAEQLRSPLVGVLVAGAGLSLALRALGDVAMIAAVIGANALVGTWQERQAGHAADELRRMTAQRAKVLRDGQKINVAAEEVVVGDVIVLAPGERIAADARVIEADALEVDEAALTGESMPVPKSVDNGTDESRVVLAGTDVVVGTGRAVAVAVGEDSRMGAVSAALAHDDIGQNPLDRRLGEILRAAAPLIIGAGLAVVVAGALRSRPLVPQFALGASIAIAAVPEGLPLLAGIAEAGVAKRLARRRALVSRLSSVEALGRVDVLCADKTGTLTEGRLRVTGVVDPEGNREGPPDLSPQFRDILLAAAFASPHPDAPDARAHPTDVAVLEVADRAGLEGRVRTERTAEIPFDPSRSFHAAVAGRRLRVKGAAEVVIPRSTRVRTADGERPLDDEGRRRLLDRADALAEDGLRVLMVAEGDARTSLEDPTDLVAVGFLGISDPLRPSVRAAVERCQAAGVRPLMLTGDHPETARAIAREAGLNGSERAVLTGAELRTLGEDELQERLERASVVARITPLDKVRIVEALQQAGHVVAMTGDGVNDAPALRLADVGVAMGRGGTEVARQAAEVIVTDDNFSTLVEALVEGRGFWLNIRRALGLLLGGNLGELGLMVTAVVAGLPSPLTTRQILTVNLVTDVLPAVAVAVQEPEHRDLSKLAREGASGLDRPLRNDVVRRGIATATPSLAAYMLAARMTPGPQAQAVAFASIVGTQLAQTVDIGRAEGRLTGSVRGAVAGSAALVAAAIAFPPLRMFLGFGTPSLAGIGLAGSASVAAVGLGRVLPINGSA